MASHLLGVLQPSVVLQINGDAGCSPGVTSNGGEKTRCLGPVSFAGEFIGPAREQRSFVGGELPNKDFRAAVASTRLRARALLRKNAAYGGATDL